MPKPLYAILLDGGFLTRMLRRRLSRSVTAEDVQAECQRWTSLPQIADYELLRIYFYDAHPAKSAIALPVSGGKFELSKTPRFVEAQKLHSRLELMPHMALGMSELILSRENWRLTGRCTRELKRSPRTLQDSDFRTRYQKSR